MCDARLCMLLVPLQVLHNPNDITCESDVYSLGIVMWEVLTRQVPWSAEAGVKAIYTRVLLNGDRPDIPTDAPAALAGLVRACWATEPCCRPKMDKVMFDVKSFSANEALQELKRH